MYIQGGNMQKQSHKKAILSLIALCIMYIIFSGLVFNTITLYMEPIVSELEITRTQFMMTITILGIISAVLTLFAYGPVVGKLGLRKTLLFSGICIVLAMAIFANAANLAMLYIGAVLFGIGITFLSVGSTGIGVNTWFSKRMATMISVVTTCGGIAGIAFSPAVGSWISGFGWRNSFWITIIITTVFTIIMFILYSDSPEKAGEAPMWSEQVAQEGSDAREADVVTAPAETGVGFREMFRTPQFYLLSISYLLIGIIFYSVMGNMPIFSADHGLDSVAQGTVLSVIFAATAISMVPMGALCDKLGSKVFLLICSVAVIVALVVLSQPFSDTLPIYVAAVLIGIAYTGVNIPCPVSVMEGLGSKEYSKKMPIVLGCMLLGVALGSPILQLFYDLGGSYIPGFYTYIVLIALAAIMMFFATKLAKSKQ